MSQDPGASDEHYFTREPSVPSAPRVLQVRVAGFPLVLTTDRGVFSHGKVDRGTRLLAEALTLREGARVLDLGCGYGVLGLVAALKCPTCRVTLVDVNARACRLAARNAHDNGLAHLEVVEGDPRQVLAGREFDFIVTNPPCRTGRRTVLDLFRWSSQALAPQGELWCVIQTNKGARRYARDLLAWFAEVQTVKLSGGYRVFRALGPGEGHEGQEQPAGED